MNTQANNDKKQTLETKKTCPSCFLNKENHAKLSTKNINFTLRVKFIQPIRLSYIGD